MSDEREHVRIWASSQWGEPVEVVFFARKRFELNLPNRTTFGTYSLGRKILGILAIPLYLPWGLANLVLSYWGRDIEPNWPTRLGTLSARGMMPYGPVVDFVDVMKKAPKKSFVVFSKSHVAFFEEGSVSVYPEPFWQSDSDMFMEICCGAEEGVLRIFWPKYGVAILKLTEEEDVIVKNYAQLHGAGWSRFR